MANNKVYKVDTNIPLGLCWLWQYDKAEKIKKILDGKNDFIKNNVSNFWENWQKTVFNINTADTFGLKIWGGFLGVERPTYTNETGETIVFTDDQYRTIIKGRLLLMMSNGSVHDINAYLNYLFPGKSVFCVDYHDMSINLVFYYQPTDEEIAIIKSDGFLPRPAGVLVNYIIVPPDEVFGFYGQELSTFDNGSFLS